MEFIDVIKNRRSIRHFTDEDITHEEIKEIIEAGILAPSAHNRQPWHFIVVEDINLKEKIASWLRLKKSEAEMTANVIKSSKALILVFAQMENELMDIQSVGASIENMVLMAFDKNIGSLWIGYIVAIEKELQEMFKTNKKLIAAVALGKTNVFPKPRPRKEIDEVLEWY